jgi:hypothetical protein
VNVFCTISKEVYGPFFFEEPTVTGMIYLDMLEHWLMPQLTEDSNGYIFQEDGCPAHYQRCGRVSQLKFATKMDSTQRTRRRCINVVATLVT